MFESIEDALASSTGWINGKDDLYGYLSLDAANFLVGTGTFEFHAVHVWGYIVRRKTT